MNGLCKREQLRVDGNDSSKQISQSQISQLCVFQRIENTVEEMFEEEKFNGDLNCRNS